MSDNKPTPSELLLAKPFRRSRSERTLGLFSSTSYSHASLGTLAMAVLAKSLGDEGVHGLAKEVLEVERTQDLGTFIRCVQAKMQGNLTNVRYKAYDFDKYTGTINDNRVNHITVGDIIVTTDSDVKMEVDTGLLLHLLEESAKVIIPKRVTKPFDAKDVKWLKYESTPTNMQTGAVSVTSMDIVKMFETEVGRKTLNVTFTPKTITFRHQESMTTYKKPHVA